MKKFVMLGMVILMMVSLCIPAVATTGGFVSSPSGNQAPQMMEADNKNEQCTAEIVITAYANRDQLSDNKRQALEAAYAEIVDTEDLSALNKKVKKMAKKLGVDVSELAVSDLFDISMTECADHAKHGKFDITLKTETLENFVCLLHYYDGEWKVVKNAEISKEDYLEFSQADFSPFAIVTYTGDQNIQKDGNALLVGIIVASSATVGTAVYLGVKFGTFAKMFANIAKLFKFAM